MRKINDGLNTKKIWRDSCVLLTFLFFGAGCASVAYFYARFELGMMALGWSTPPSKALEYGMPFALLAAVCAVVSVVLTKKLKSE